MAAFIAVLSVALPRRGWAIVCRSMSLGDVGRYLSFHANPSAESRTIVKV